MAFMHNGYHSLLYDQISHRTLSCACGWEQTISCRPIQVRAKQALALPPFGNVSFQNWFVSFLLVELKLLPEMFIKMTNSLFSSIFLTGSNAKKKGAYHQVAARVHQWLSRFHPSNTHIKLDLNLKLPLPIAEHKAVWRSCHPFHTVQLQVLTHLPHTAALPACSSRSWHEWLYSALNLWPFHIPYVFCTCWRICMHLRSIGNFLLQEYHCQVTNIGTPHPQQILVWLQLGFDWTKVLSKSNKNDASESIH